MSQDIRAIAIDFPRFFDLLRTIPWFLNVGKPHPRDHEVVRIRDWTEWHGPEKGYGAWFGRYPAIVSEHLETGYPRRKAELKVAWRRVEQLVMELAIPNVPAYRADEDAWYGPTICVWHAGNVAALVGWHVLLGHRLPEPIWEQWTWLSEGHWPCDYAEEPPGYGDESLVDVPASKLLVF